VQAAARPGVVEPKALVHDERPRELVRAAACVVERVVALEPPVDLRPVQDVVSARVDARLVQPPDPRLVVAHSPGW
jgi:hypothetical protein